MSDQLYQLFFCIYDEFVEAASDVKFLKTSSVITDKILKLYSDDFDNINIDFIIPTISVVDMFTYEKIDKELDEKLSDPYKYFGLLPQSLK